MTAIWDDEHRTAAADCGRDRCPINKFEGQCHLRRDHVGVCDPYGESHLEADMQMPYWRVGGKNAMNIYLVTEECPQGDPVGVFFDKTGDDSRQVVAALNMMKALLE